MGLGEREEDPCLDMALGFMGRGALPATENGLNSWAHWLLLFQSSWGNLAYHLTASRREELPDFLPHSNRKPELVGKDLQCLSHCLLTAFPLFPTMKEFPVRGGVLWFYTNLFS